MYAKVNYPIGCANLRLIVFVYSQGVNVVGAPCCVAMQGPRPGVRLFVNIVFAHLSVCSKHTTDLCFAVWELRRPPH